MDGPSEIVGITGDIRHAALSDPFDADVYVPRRQVVRDNTWLLLKTDPSGCCGSRRIAGAREVD